jgi:hypothetical protein
MTGLVGGRFDLKDFYEKLRAAVVGEPERARSEWRVALMRCVRVSHDEPIYPRRCKFSSAA